MCSTIDTLGDVDGVDPFEGIFSELHVTEALWRETDMMRGGSKGKGTASQKRVHLRMHHSLCR